MLEEEQISFRSASLMFDGVEDYSHQIAEMIGLRNESNFIQAGVSRLELLEPTPNVNGNILNSFIFLGCLPSCVVYCTYNRSLSNFSQVVGNFF